MSAARWGAITLKREGRNLAALSNPLVVVANYFFDSIPTDAFRVRDGKLYEARTRFVRTEEGAGFGGFRSEEEVVPATPGHYGDPCLDGILASYARDYAEGSVLMPIAAIRCLQTLLKASGRRLLLLSIDKGVTTRRRIEGWFEQAFVSHGPAFSYMVNFDGLRRFLESNGGRAMTSTWDDRSLVCFIGVLPAAVGANDRLERFFDEQIDAVDAFNANVSFVQGIHALPRLTEVAGVAALIDLLARMRADPNAFSAVMYRAIDVIAEARPGVRSLARRLAASAKADFFSLRFHNDVFYWSGRLHYAPGEFDLPGRDFDASVARFGPKSHAHFFLGAIAEIGHDRDLARHHYTRVVQPDCPATRDALRRVRPRRAQAEERSLRRT